MNSEKVPSWHGIIILPTQHVQERREVTAKTGCTSCTKRTISFEVSGFRTKTHLLQRDFIFLLIRTPDFLCGQNAPFKATSLICPFYIMLLYQYLLHYGQLLHVMSQYLWLFSLILQGLHKEGECRQLEFWAEKGANIGNLFCTAPIVLKLHESHFWN